MPKTETTLIQKLIKDYAGSLIDGLFENLEKAQEPHKPEPEPTKEQDVKADGTTRLAMDLSGRSLFHHIKTHTPHPEQGVLMGVEHRNANRIAHVVVLSIGNVGETRTVFLSPEDTVSID